MTLNRGWTYHAHIGLADSGSTLLEYLTRTWSHSTAGQWQARIDAGEIDLNSQRAASDARIHAGAIVTWRRSPWDEPGVPLSYTVLYEDAAVLAVDKPGGLPTMPAGGFLEHTLLTIVQRDYPGARPIHRLGRGTSGLVLFARTRESAAGLSRMWRHREVHKHYRALVTGAPTWDTCEIDAPIGRVDHPRLGGVHGAVGSTGAPGKNARSVATVVERRAAGTLVDVEITTGRPHQIRIHLAWTGHALAGDPLYVAGGVPRTESPGLPGDTGYLLHAHRVRLAHPVTGAGLDLTAPLPRGLRAADER
jgi:23S rRNA pseudouridine1911/1915/1917 synthase